LQGREVDTQGQRAVLLAMAALSVLGLGRSALHAVSRAVVAQAVGLWPMWAMATASMSKKRRTNMWDAEETSTSCGRGEISHVLSAWVGVSYC